MISWDCLPEVVRLRGFREKWIAWVKNWLMPAKFIVLVSKESCKEIACKRGLRWGDPLSPLLFVQVATDLNNLLRKQKRQGWYKVWQDEDGDMDADNAYSSMAMRCVRRVYFIYFIFSIYFLTSLWIPSAWACDHCKYLKYQFLKRFMVFRPFFGLLTFLIWYTRYFRKECFMRAHHDLEKSMFYHYIFHSKALHLASLCSDPSDWL